MIDFWTTALQGFASVQEPDEPSAPSAEDIELSEWGNRRAELGLSDTGDFLGLRRWKRPQRYVHHEQTELERYAEQRQQLGIHESPQSSAGNPRKNHSSFRSVDTGRM